MSLCIRPVHTEPPPPKTLRVALSCKAHPVALRSAFLPPGATGGWEVKSQILSLPDNTSATFVLMWLHLRLVRDSLGGSPLMGGQRQSCHPLFSNIYRLPGQSLERENRTSLSFTLPLVFPPTLDQKVLSLSSDSLCLHLLLQE